MNRGTKNSASGPELSASLFSSHHPNQPTMPRRKTWDAEKLADALFDVHDEGLTPYASSQKHGVPRKTLQNHIDGTHQNPAEQQIQPAQRLTRTQELQLSEWIIRQEKLGYAPTASVVKAVAASICRKNGDMRPMGVNWIMSFKKRNPEVITKIGKKQEGARFSAFTPKAVH